MNAHAQFTNAVFYEALKAKLKVAKTETETVECAHGIDSDAFKSLPDDAQLELLALFGALAMRRGWGAM